MKIEFDNLESFTILYKNILSPELCAEIISQFEIDSAASKGKVIHSDYGHIESETKQSIDLTIEPDGSWKPLYDKLHSSISKLVMHYAQTSPSLHIYPIEGSGYKIQKYLANEGFFKWHFDSVSPATHMRLFAMVLYLNDVEQGGETELYHQKIKIKPTAGHAVFFPARRRSAINSAFSCRSPSPSLPTS